MYGKVRVQGIIDQIVTLDYDGEIHISNLIDDADVNYVTPQELREAGFTVTPVQDPEEDTPGTVRRSTAGTWYIKGEDGDWYVMGPKVTSTLTANNTEVVQ